MSNKNPFTPNEKAVIDKIFESEDKIYALRDAFFKYERSLKYERDLKNSLDYAYKEGLKEGRAIRMKKKNVPIEKIAEITGLTKEEIKNL